MRRTVPALLAVLALAAPAAAATPRTTLPDVEDEVMCTVCGTPLNVAGGPAAEDERTLVRRLIADGQSKQQIKDALVREYGQGVLALPEAKGFNYAVYLVPIALLTLVVALLVVALPRWRARQVAAVPAAGPELDPADLARLDDDLARYGR